MTYIQLGREHGLAFPEVVRINPDTAWNGALL